MADPEATCWEFPKGNNPPGLGTLNEDPTSVGTPRPPVPDGDTNLLESHFGGKTRSEAVIGNELQSTMTG